MGWPKLLKSELLPAGEELQRAAGVSRPYVRVRVHADTKFEKGPEALLEIIKSRLQDGSWAGKWTFKSTSQPYSVAIYTATGKALYAYLDFKVGVEKGSKSAPISEDEV